MSEVILRAFILLTVFCLTSCVDTDYYWREYTGKIPSDAVVAGVDINGDSVYIGQAYVKNSGLIVVHLSPNLTEIYAPMIGAKKIEDYIKILCGHSNAFSWLPTNSTNLHLDLLGKIPVIGGHEDGYGKIYIGRIHYEGGTQIGKINAFSVGSSSLFWVDKHKKESNVGSYEVLIYDVIGFDERVNL